MVTLQLYGTAYRRLALAVLEKPEAALWYHSFSIMPTAQGLLSFRRKRATLRDVTENPDVLIAAWFLSSTTGKPPIVVEALLPQQQPHTKIHFGQTWTIVLNNSRLTTSEDDLEDEWWVERHEDTELPSRKRRRIDGSSHTPYECLRLCEGETTSSH